MISDNYVAGDNIFLGELQSFFFEVLGMMSITHYGAIGDGRTDNYGPLQVAIDDANRRGLSFIYVPYGKFIYTGELINIGDIIFIGNPHAKIVNIRTGQEIEIKQFGWMNEDNFYTKAEADDRYVNVAGDTMIGGLAIGSTSSAQGAARLAVGNNCEAVGDRSMANGRGCQATGHNSHAEGDRTVASDWNAHAEGYFTIASGHSSHAEGQATTASGDASFAEGDNTIANGKAQHVEGTFNIADTSNSEPSLKGEFIHIAGNGVNNARSNAYTLDWSGNGWFSGDVYVGSTSGTHKDEGSKKLATEEYVNSHVSSTPSAITAYLDDYFTAVGGQTTELVPLTQNTVMGSGLSVDTNGKVAVGTGISFVEISMVASSDAPFVVIKKNNSTVAVIDNRTNNVFDTMSAPPFILSVTNGDTISLNLMNHSAGDQVSGNSAYLETYLTVRAIG